MLLLLILEGLVWLELSEHRQADRKADEPFHFLWGQFTCHRLWVNKHLLSKHPSSDILHSDQPKKQAPVPSTCCYHSPNDFKTQVFRFQYCSGFSSLFLYNRKLFKSYDMTVNFTNQVHIICIILYMLWYTTLVLMKDRTSFVRWCSHLWH